MSNSHVDQDLVAMEKALLKEWDDKDIIRRSIDSNNGAELFRFIEGPPTANGSPGVHHVYARVVKDLFCRYKTMQGYHVPRVSGWDCHGLPVEISVEKELSFENKSHIEMYGVERFNEVCRSSVFSHIDEWSDMTKRIGFFIDLDRPYTTMASSYIESVWWSLKRIWDQNLIYEDHYVVPYCPRCGTGLSTHEVAQGYTTVTEEAIFVKFPVVDEEKTFLLAWTTTPWTLLSNVALAVNPDIAYVKVQLNDTHLILAKDSLRSVMQGQVSFRVNAEMQGTDLKGVRYQALFGPEKHHVVLADFVSTEEGSGIVHIAPAFGEEDFNVAKVENLPLVQLVRPDGRFDEHISLVGGLFFADANPIIVQNLKTRALLFKAEMYEHAYPFCWRCETPLMYYARKAWFIRMSSLRKELQQNNERVQWHPSALKSGRFGHFIENARDWALSRERYWGTPLPIWRCSNDHAVCIGSIKELQQQMHASTPPADVHKPYIDQITFRCDSCGEDMHRVPDVIDCWYDSGCAPFASLHYPFEQSEQFKIPVDFIAEGVDQTRGWFYSMHAIATAVFGSNAYNTVISLGHIVDEFGRKMSKSKGNAVDPWRILDNEGADSLRWYLLSAGSPGNPKKFYESAIVESQRKTIATLWNVLSFFETYANIDEYELAWWLAAEQRNTIDKWMLSRINGLNERVIQHMDNYDYFAATVAIDSFIDDLSNWFVRTSRRRFWKSEHDTDKRSAYVTLYEALRTLSKLMAPFTPFIADYIYQTLSQYDESSKASVHLERYPLPKLDLISPTIEQQMEYTRKIVEAGRVARSAAHIKTRQPLKRLICIGSDLANVELRTLVCNELNIKAIDFGAKESDFAEHDISLNYSTVGPKYRELVSKIKRELSRLESSTVLQQLDTGVELDVDGTLVALSRDDLVVTEKTKPHFAKGEAGGLIVFIDTETTPELSIESLAREIVRRIQVMRKELNLPYTAHIKVGYRASTDVAQAVQDYHQYIKDETLSAAVIDHLFDDAQLTKEWTVDGHKIVLSIAE
ncbi:MAG: isoleucine--tRNA ligase [Euryarchaeota archaeon]|nr:isoleucine--tRNA ligase [Euryarchaeota archaeon]